jgi:hypothetical protein
MRNSWSTDEDVAARARLAPHTQTSPTMLPQRNLLRQLTWGHRASA